MTRRRRLDRALIERSAGGSNKRRANAIERAARGLIDADLGGGVIKQRVARAGQGRSGGYRMLIADRAKARSVFPYGFAKQARENIDPDELLTLREIGAAWLVADAARIAWALRDDVLQKVTCGDETQG